MLSIVTAMLVWATGPTTPLASSPAPARPRASASATAAVDDSKVRCRKTPVTGSLARFTRECRTVGEWRKLDEQYREAATRMQDRGTSSCLATGSGEGC